MGDSEEEIVSTRGTAISMSPKALVALIAIALGLAGGGGSWITGLLHGNGDTARAELKTGQEDQAVQIALLRNDLTHLTSQVAEVKDSQERILRILINHSELYKEKENKR